MTVHVLDFELIVHTTTQQNKANIFYIFSHLIPVISIYKTVSISLILYHSTYMFYPITESKDILLTLDIYYKVTGTLAV